MSLSVKRFVPSRRYPGTNPSLAAAYPVVGA